MIFSFATVSAAVLIQPFMRFWIGDETGNLFNYSTVILLLIYFYIFGLRRTILMTKDSAGLYRPDRYFAIVEAIINIVLSVVLVMKYRTVDSLILANIISILIVPFWTQPALVYKHILHKRLINYYVKYFLYACITTLLTALTLWISNTIINVQNIFLELILKAIICLIIPNVLNFVLFYKTKEMQGIIGMLKGILQNKQKGKI